MKKVELLAPAGNYEGFLGAIHAGADAVYLGGIKFGARAFADNFDEDTLKRAIYYAHLFDRKVYLTLNTLLKQSELEEITDFLTPFYLAGLDGVIVQDLGLLKLIKENFPLLELHISTQMAVTGPYSVRMLKEAGACRVVPARELSLEEMKLLKEEGLEIETFIHGAMCYSYSGQCFFSSILGGRSGNRGKCAQSCRLPYQVNIKGCSTGKNQGKKRQTEEYPLSLKDMCSIELLPELMAAGIDSFKIEGRMKRPEYAAGVTAIYRKYIDLVYKNRGKNFRIEEKDWEVLRSLYIRSEIQDGYYHRHNGKEMVTLDKPSYSGMQEEVGQQIYDTYIRDVLKAEVSGRVELVKGQPAKLSLDFKNHTVLVSEGMVEQASKRPMEQKDVEKQISKTGNTDFKFSNLSIIMENDIFIPVKTLNELRRKAFEQLEQSLIMEIKEVREASLPDQVNTIADNKRLENETSKDLYVSVDHSYQCRLAMKYPQVKRLYVAGELLLEDEKLLSELKELSHSKEVWIKFPWILRKNSYGIMEELLKLSRDFAKGILISNLESYAYLTYNNYGGAIGCNHHIYFWNKKALEFWEEKASSFLAPLECNIHEWKTLCHQDFEYYCYGKIPMMVTANCIRLTKESCRGYGRSFEDSLTDRYQTSFRVQTNCYHCYNVIYNSVPISLHQYVDTLEKLKGKGLRLEFTTESETEMKQVLEEYIKLFEKKNCDFSFLKEYTTAHFKKGAL
ncbi:MAG: U32 family peptidase [Lachnospiraceae bacterium]|nr:U32 family peptidase [Lachnospiraceae bacterium]